MTTTTDLAEFEGDKVVGTTVAIRGAGDGLSKALKIEPVALHRGKRVCVILETLVGPIGFVPVPGVDGVVTRKHDLLTEVATIVDYDLVADLLTAQRAKLVAEEERVKLEKEAAKGVQRLPGTTADGSAGDPDPDAGAGDEWDDGGAQASNVASIAERTGRRPRARAAAADTPDPGVDAAAAARARITEGPSE